MAEVKLRQRYCRFDSQGWETVVVRKGNGVIFLQSETRRGKEYPIATCGYSEMHKWALLTPDIERSIRYFNLARLDTSRKLWIQPE